MRVRTTSRELDSVTVSVDSSRHEIPVPAGLYCLPAMGEMDHHAMVTAADAGHSEEQREYNATDRGARALLSSAEEPQTEKWRAG